MERSLVRFAFLVVLVTSACDPEVPQQSLPDGVESASSSVCQEALPIPATCNTGSTCDTSSCTSISQCPSSACFRATCLASCCGFTAAPNTQTCSGTTCCVNIGGTCTCPAGINCNSGFGNCNGTLSDGCETSLSSVTSCGSTCGNATNCNAAVLHATTIQCSGSACTYGGACATGWGDCDSNKANGCETSVLTSATSCGTCGIICPAPDHATPVCNSGACAFTCNAGFVRCGDVCAQCCGDGDCASPPTKCQTGTCTSGTCSYDAKNCVQQDCYSAVQCDVADGQCKSTSKITGSTCGGNACLANAGTCNDGVCTGAVAKDCSSLNGPCKTGVCDSASGGACVAQDTADGTVCVSDNKCLIAPTCNGGVCLGEATICADPGQCRSATCNTATGVCDVTALLKGEPCTVNNPCRQNEACDGAGTCDGTNLSDGTPCAQTCGTDEAGSCISGACTCLSTLDMSVSFFPDAGLNAPDMAKGAGKSKGCSTVPLDASTLSLCLIVAACLRVRRRRRA